jgi:hypothetical protein
MILVLLSTLTISKQTQRVMILMLSVVCCRMSKQKWIRIENLYSKKEIIVFLLSSIDRKVVVGRLQKIVGHFAHKMREKARMKFFNKYKGVI